MQFITFINLWSRIATIHLVGDQCSVSCVDPVMEKTQHKLPVALRKMLAALIGYLIFLLVITLIKLCFHVVILLKLLQAFPLVHITFESMRRHFATTIYLVDHPRSGSCVDPGMEKTQQRVRVAPKEAFATLSRYLIFSLIPLFITLCYHILLKLLQSFTFIQKICESTKRCFRCPFAVCEMPPQLSSTQAKVYQQRPAKGQVPEGARIGRKEQGTTLSTLIEVSHSPLLRLSTKEDLASNLKRTAQCRRGLPKWVLQPPYHFSASQSPFQCAVGTNTLMASFPKEIFLPGYGSLAEGRWRPRRPTGRGSNLQRGKRAQHTRHKSIPRRNIYLML
uniref:Uncharacterized protein n=1 Tax=Pogona vitticeps TaxID=103695 RepID=A0ABM5FI01_9SAUR